MKLLNIFSLASLASTINAVGNTKPSIVLSELGGKVWKISGANDGKLACLVQYVSQASYDDLTVTVSTRGRKGGYKCKFSKKHKISGSYGKKYFWYKQASKTKQIKKMFGVNGLSDVVSDSHADFSWTREMTIINDSKGKNLKLEFIDYDGDLIDSTPSGLNDFGDAFDCSRFEHKDAGACVLNSCTCSNGWAAKKCDADGKEACKRCDYGWNHTYERGGGYCTINQCRCYRELQSQNFMSLGVGSTGPECPQNYGNNCASCADGLTLVNGRCEGKHCYCYNGVQVPSTDDKCDAVAGFEGRHEEQCEICDFGYYKARNAPSDVYFDWNNWGCHRNICVCPHGEGTTGDNCPLDGETMCSWCNSGYALDEMLVCQEKTCQCPNGSGAKKHDCIKEELHRCASCDEDYSVGPAHWGEESGYLEWHCIADN